MMEFPLETLEQTNAAEFLRHARDSEMGSGNGGWAPAACVERHDFKDAASFVEHLHLSSPFWGNGSEGDWYFRGQCDAKWPLLPSLRRFDGIAKLWPLIIECFREVRLSYAAPEDIGVARSLFSMALDRAEMQAVDGFARLSDELGLYSPEEVEWIQAGAPLLDGVGLSHANSAWYAYAQHHGIPTRMLDWTRKATNAAFFAVDQLTDSKSEHLAVWAIHRDVLRHRMSPLSESTCGRWQHTYLHAQDGLFILRPQDSLEFVDTGHWLPFDHVVDRWQQKPKGPLFRLLTLPMAEAHQLRRLLWRERVSRAHLMPGYSNVATAMLDNWTWTNSGEQSRRLRP